MELQELHDQMLGFIRHQYENNTKPDYDIEPFAHMVSGDKHSIVMLAGMGNPIDTFSMLLNDSNLPEALRDTVRKLDMISFASAVWHREPQEDGTTRRTGGEGVMVLTESRTERLSAMFSVGREPLPVITLNPDTPDSIYARVPLLYKPTEH